MSDDASIGLDIRGQLLALLPDAGNEVDVEFFSLKLGLDRTQIESALGQLAQDGLLHSEQRWRCAECGAAASLAEAHCPDCHNDRDDAQPITIFIRPPRSPTRDPAAVFLIHGMNTLGDWQQALAWKIQLIYGYSVPVFVFKFGRDRVSPMAEFLQNRRRIELGHAVIKAQADLVKAGRNTRCDVIAHSFGTLLVTQLLQDPRFEEISFGRLILTGSIAASDVPWRRLLADERVEAVLNHRGGRDRWVPIAPLFFPRVNATGTHGFDEGDVIEDFLSPSFGHSDFFAESTFDSTIAQVWAQFLNNRLNPTKTFLRSSGSGAWNFYGIGRLIIAFVGFWVAFAALELVALLGMIAQYGLKKLGL